MRTWQTRDHIWTSLQNKHPSSRIIVSTRTVKCEGRALSLASLVPRRFGLEAWRVLEEEYEGKGGNRTAALLRGILNPRARWEKIFSDERDLGDMLASWEEDVAPYRIAVGADLQQAVQVATVMEHASAVYRDLLEVVPLTNRESHQVLRAYVREWTLAQRTYDDLGRYTTPDTSAPMDTGQVKGTKGKGKKGKKAKGKENGKSKKDNSESKGNAWTHGSYFAGECGYLWQVETQER